MTHSIVAKAEDQAWRQLSSGQVLSGLDNTGSHHSACIVSTLSNVLTTT